MQLQHAAGPPAAPAPAAPARAGPTLNVEAAAWALVLAAAAAWRLPGLGRALPATAEALRARAVWEFAHGVVPAGWTGDLTDGIAALVVRAGGDGLGWVRLPAALCGLALVAAPALLRPWAGRGVAVLAAVLLACSPLAVAASRTAGPDTAALFAGLLLVWLAFRIGEAGDARALPLLGTVAGIALTTGAVAVALALIVAAWVAVEVAWLDRRAVAARWRRALGERTLLLQSLALALPGLALGLLRFGAGPERLSLPALADWSGAAAPDAPLPWHGPLVVLAAYEPLALALGAAGFVVVVVRWRRRGAGAVTAFQRLLVVWAALALPLTLVALDRRPGQLVLLLLPLVFLAADLTLRALSSLRFFNPRESGLPLLPLAVIAGYGALQVLAWTNAVEVPRGEAARLVLLVFVGAGLVYWVLRQSPPAVPGVLVVGAWLLVGWVPVHGAAAVAFAEGNELLRGRPRPEQAAVGRGIDDALAMGRTVAVERGLAEALAWVLRGREVRVFTGLPPTGWGDVLLIMPQLQGDPTLTPPRSVGQVEERWYPETWDTLGAVRWLVYRIPWEPVDVLTGVIVERVPAPTDARPRP
jgi:4-amino-4-deoxy-L-arabinose transferase-like glycosyltransferase